MVRSRGAFYITRADHWSFEARERVPISKDEWLAYVACDPDFQPIDTEPAVNQETGEVIEFSLAGQGLWEWTVYSRRRDMIATFQYNRGGIIVRAPDSEILSKAKAVAAALRARALSDDMP
ncbi:hypothetical protein BH10PLA2_BH10PLA2_11330 [soil metagenome]